MPEIEINKVAAQTMTVPIIGTAPLIVHKFSEKAKRAMLDKMQGRRNPKEPREPQSDYESSLYRTKSGYGFPAVAFKAATVDAARFYGKSIRMTEIRQFVFIRGELSENDPQQLVEIAGEPRMREDVVRLTGTTTDLRYRAEFPEWSTTLEVTYVSSCLSKESVLSLIDAGGLGVGIGEWRPEKNGDYGTFRIDPTREVVMLSE
jgi:hypothetical protein